MKSWSWTCVIFPRHCFKWGTFSVAKQPAGRSLKWNKYRRGWPHYSYKIRGGEIDKVKDALSLALGLRGGRERPKWLILIPPDNPSWWREKKCRMPSSTGGVISNLSEGVGDGEKSVTPRLAAAPCYHHVFNTHFSLTLLRAFLLALIARLIHWPKLMVLIINFSSKTIFLSRFFFRWCTALYYVHFHVKIQ